MMKRLLLLLTGTMVLSLGSLAQSDSLQRQINEQVWKPFINSFSNADSEGFKAVHSLDLIRVIQDDKKVLGYDQYFKRVPDSLRIKWGKWKKSIELRFIQRLAASGKAFESGFYKTSSINLSTGEKRISYGKFMVLLRKENGKWKILVDSDARDNADESAFRTGKSME